MRTSEFRLPRRDLLARIIPTGLLAVALNGCNILERHDSPVSVYTPAPPISQPRSGGTLRIGVSGDIVASAVPHVVHPSNFQLDALVYDTLVRYDQHFNPQPALATKWTWSNDFRQLTLQLRSGVKFHSGRPFTSEDAKFNLERLREPAVSSQWRGYAELMRIETPDAGTLVINYDAPLKSSFDAIALALMADPQTQEATAQGPTFVGTGPFRFKEWVQGDHVAFERNPDYWQNGKPYLDSVELRVFSDPSAGVAALEGNTLDWLTGVPGQDAKRLGADAAYQTLLSGNGGTFHYVGLDLANADLADRRVRQAFGYAMNRQRMVDIALYGYGRPTCLPWPTQSIGYDPAQDRTYVYDLDRARALLRDANWDATHIIPLVVPDFVPLAKSVAQILQADLQSIGVRISVQTASAAEFGSLGLKRRFGGAWISPMTFTNLSPATFLTTASMVRIPNASNFVTPRYQQLIQEALSATEDQTLKAKVHEVTQIMLDEAFILPFAEGAGQLAGPEVIHSRVNNARWDGFGLFAYEDVWLNQ